MGRSISDDVILKNCLGNQFKQEKLRKTSTQSKNPRLNRPPIQNPQLAYYGVRLENQDLFSKLPSEVRTDESKKVGFKGDDIRQLAQEIIEEPVAEQQPQQPDQPQGGTEQPQGGTEQLEEKSTDLDEVDLDDDELMYDEPEEKESDDPFASLPRLPDADLDMPEPLQPPEPPPEEKFSALRGLQQDPRSVFFTGETSAREKFVGNVIKEQKKIADEIREELNKPSQNLGKITRLQKLFDKLGKQIDEEERATQEETVFEGQAEEPKEVENVMNILNEIGEPVKARRVPSDTPSEIVRDFPQAEFREPDVVDADAEQVFGEVDLDAVDLDEGMPDPIQAEGERLTPMQKSKIGKKKYTEMSYSDFQSEYKTSVPKQKRKQENKRYITSEYTKKRKGTGQHDVWSVVSRFEKERGEGLTYGEIRYITTKMGHDLIGNILGDPPKSRVKQGRKSLEQEGIFRMVNDDDPDLR